MATTEKTAPTIVESFITARKRGVSLLCFRGPDLSAMYTALLGSLAKDRAPFTWDIVRGMRPSEDANGVPNKLAVAVAARNEPESGIIPIVPGKTVNPVEALDRAATLPPGSVLFFFNAQRYFMGDKAAGVIQAMALLRDKFKKDQRTLVMLVPEVTFPIELEQDVIIFDDPLPDDQELGSIVKSMYVSGGLDDPDDKTLSRVVDGVRGLSAFTTEQVVSMALTPSGININLLRQRTNSAIEQTPGLLVDRDTFTFDDIGGLKEAKRDWTDLMNGPAPPRLIVRWEEIEKALGGQGDTSGVSQDLTGVVLTEMEDNDWYGMIYYGVAGSGKSLLCKACGNSFGIRSIRMDINATKASLVGESGKRARQMMRRIKSIAGVGGACFVASANKLVTVSPEMRRRFRYGIWMFDLPDNEEKKPIWEINLRKYQALGYKNLGDKRPDDGVYTGADIRNVVEKGWRYGRTLLDASRSIVPVAISDPDAIKEMRELADGSFLSASYPGKYRKPDESAAPVIARAIDLTNN